MNETKKLALKECIESNLAKYNKLFCTEAIEHGASGLAMTYKHFVDTLEEIKQICVDRNRF